MKRRRIEAKEQLIDFTDVAYHGRPLRAYLANLQVLLQDFSGPEYDDAIIRVVSHYEGPNDTYIVSFRDETDKEMQKRLARTKLKNLRAKQAREKAKADKAVQERQELQRLLAKYKPSDLLEDN